MNNVSLENSMGADANVVFDSKSHSNVFAHMQILYNTQQKQKPLQRDSNKNKTTRATKIEAKKVNNMPNLQSMSQAKGYGRLHKKPTENESCLNKIDHKTLIRSGILYSISFMLGFKLIGVLETGSEWHCSYLRE